MLFFLFILIFTEFVLFSFDSNGYKMLIVSLFLCFTALIVNMNVMLENGFSRCLLFVSVLKAS